MKLQVFLFECSYGETRKVLQVSLYYFERSFREKMFFSMNLTFIAATNVIDIDIDIILY